MSQKEFGCFFCVGKSSTFDGVCSDCGRAIDITASLKGITIGGYKAIKVVGRGFNGWTLKVEDTYQAFAMKVIPRHRLSGKTVADEEARALAACAQHRNIARFFRPIDDVVTVQDVPIQVFGLVFEFIENAQPLSKLISSTAELERRDIAGILIGIASGLARMHASGLWHHDFHDDNILIRTVGSDENLSERFESKLIDFGSTRPLSATTPEPSGSDYWYLSKHIFGLVAAFEAAKRTRLTPPDRAFAGKLRRLAHLLADKDISRRKSSPTDVVNDIRVALEESTTGYNFPSFDEMRQQIGISFEEPLGNTNALSLAPQDITLLFRDSLGWRKRIEKSEPVLVVGPRGCGKTMFLRFLSIVSRARPLKDENKAEQVAERLAKEGHIGFLVNVGQLRTPFLRSGYKKLEAMSPATAEDFCREYLNSQFVFEVLRTVIWLRTERLIHLTLDDETSIAATAGQFVSGRQGGVSAPQLETLAEIFDRRIMELSSLNDPSAYSSTELARDDVLVRLARCIRDINWCHDKEVWFLLDDYSVTVLPALAQQAYNPVIFRLSNQVKIKISSEGEGPLLTDTLGRKYREGRELTKLNLGEVYFACAEDDGRRFFEQILDARFQATGRGHLATLKKLLSEHEHDGNFGNYIRSLARPGDARFYGFGLLCRLCSGDVSFIIELLHSLTRGKWDQDVEPLSSHEQDVIVKRFAHRQLAELRTVSEYGNKLYAFACHMGELIKEYLLKSGGKEADERLRIEIEGAGELCTGARLIQDALFRHSVLISGGAGKSKKGLPTRKLYFRRLFAPCFPFSPTRKGCIDVAFEDYESWLLEPNGMNKGAKPSKRLTKSKKSLGGDADKQRQLKI
jgi:energy-coupling factor transporter ATP-binding protein EcfA2/tRNA A-37 threonylcarbamoyl transferase component Bud32